MAVDAPEQAVALKVVGVFLAARSGPVRFSCDRLASGRLRPRLWTLRPTLAPIGLGNKVMTVKKRSRRPGPTSTRRQGHVTLAAFDAGVGSRSSSAESDSRSSRRRSPLGPIVARCVHFYIVPRVENGFCAAGLTRWTPERAGSHSSAIVRRLRRWKGRVTWPGADVTLFFLSSSERSLVYCAG